MCAARCFSRSTYVKSFLMSCCLSSQPVKEPSGLMDQARGLSVPTRGKVAFALAVVSAEGLCDDGVFLWLRDVFRGGTSGKLVYNSADSLLCQCYNSNVLLMRIERRTMANIQVRVDDALRDEAVAVLNRLGMDMATAVRLLLNQIVVDNGYPFKPTSDPFYSSSNIRHLEKVLDDVKHKRNLVSHPLVEVNNPRLKAEA